MSVMDVVVPEIFAVKCTDPETWDEFYRRLLKRKLFDQVSPERSFMCYGYRKGRRNDTPVFTCHYVARVGTRAIGIGTINRFVSPDNVLDYANLYVHPDYRGQGIGRSLLARMLIDYPQLWGCRTDHSAHLYDQANVRCLSQAMLTRVIDLYMKTASLL